MSFVKASKNSLKRAEVSVISTVFGGSADLKFNTSTTAKEVNLNGRLLSSSGTSGFHALEIAGEAPATQGDIVALSIALG